MGRKKGNTRDRVIEEALKLFSVRGFEGVSMKDIAAAVDMGPSALYKHFSGKQDLFDSIVQVSAEKYMEKTAIVSEEIRGHDSFRNACLAMFHYQTGDPWIVAFRKLLLLEQFNNPDIAAIFKRFFLEIPLQKEAEIFAHLQDKGLMIPGNPEVYAMELYAPFYMFHFVSYDEEKLQMLFDGHIQHFFDTHFITKGS